MRESSTRPLLDAACQAQFEAALERLAGDGRLTGHDLRKLSEPRE